MDEKQQKAFDIVVAVLSEATGVPKDTITMETVIPHDGIMDHISARFLGGGIFPKFGLGRTVGMTVKEVVNIEYMVITLVD